MRVSPEGWLQPHAAEGMVSRNHRRARVGCGFALLLVALTASRALPAAIFQCTDTDGKAVFSDSPCGPNSRRLEVHAPAPSRAPASTSSSSTVSAPFSFSAAGQSRLEAFAIRCSTSDFNQWVQAQHPMPDWDVRRAKLIELTNRCRRAVHLPDLVSQASPPSSPQWQAQPPKDAVFAQIVKQGSVSRLQAYLRAANVDVNDRSDLDMGLLDHAAEQNQVEIARFLIEHGAKVDAAQTRGAERGTAALHRAAAADAFEVASLLIADGATVNYHGPLGTTPLIIAASHGSARTAELLLDHGADISTATGDKKTALSEAATHHYPDIVRMLILHVPTPTVRSLGTLAMNADVDAIRLLMRHDALAHDIDVVSKNTALRYAIVGGERGDRIPERERIIDLLIAAGADVNNKVDNAPNTPVMMVTSPAFADFLIARGANLNAVGWYGTAANQLACNTHVQDRLGMLRVLLAHHADITTAVRNGTSGLQCALASNRPDLVAFLRSQGVPVDVPVSSAPESGTLTMNPPIFTVTRNGRITNLTAPGNLASTHPVTCHPIDGLDDTHTPPDLYLGVKDCIEHGRYAEAADLFALAGMDSQFDAARVTDKTAGQARDILIMGMFDGMAQEKRDQFGNAVRTLHSDPRALAVLCRQVRRIGYPAYYPEYMVMHGMRAFLGDPHANALDTHFDPDATWALLQARYLNCP